MNISIYDYILIYLEGVYHCNNDLNYKLYDPSVAAFHIMSRTEKCGIMIKLINSNYICKIDKEYKATKKGLERINNIIEELNIGGLLLVAKNDFLEQRRKIITYKEYDSVNYVNYYNNELLILYDFDNIDTYFNNTIYLNCWVKVLDIEDDKIYKYSLVTDSEADFDKNKISINSTFGSELVGKKNNECFKVKSRKYMIDSWGLLKLSGDNIMKNDINKTCYNCVHRKKCIQSHLKKICNEYKPGPTKIFNNWPKEMSYNWNKYY